MRSLKKGREKKFLFGVTFYPDQWPQSIWKENFVKIRKSGFNIVRFGEMAWDWIEPEEGSFTWKGLDMAMKLAHEEGIKVILGLATSQAPVWLIRKYPRVRPVSHTGVIYPEYGPRPNICRDSETYKRLAKRYITAMVSNSTMC